ncbi:MAG: branched-chain amino acid transport system II carrier protein [Pseudoflavonifractor sp.]|nr:branched-chain amino acid transport system II carrier protein [Pseudoflavonifractor sp.]
MDRRKGRELLLIGFTLFSMFFGAGNLIFPPGIAARAGTMTWAAMAGLAVSAVGLPVLGVVAVARSGGLDALGGRVHPAFARVFTILAYLSIGPCLAIPRTASTSFETVLPLVGDAARSPGLIRLVYSVVFFAAALCLALRPEKLTDRLGKIMCPVLIGLIVVTFAGCLAAPLPGYGPPSAGFENAGRAAAAGFLEGYQTMDTIAALVFGIVISLNVRARGVTDENEVVRMTARAGVVAGGMLLVIYSMLAHIGALSGGAFPGAANGAGVLTRIVSALFGPMGSVLLAAIFVIACFNVCVGLISSCGEYFAQICPRLSYRKWAVIFAAVSLLLANAGLDRILAFSVPVLNTIYPVAIVLILLSFADRWLAGRDRVYPVTILFTGAASLLFEAGRLAGIGFLQSFPLAEAGLGWVLPALAGLILGLFLSRGQGRHNEKRSDPHA